MSPEPAPVDRFRENLDALSEASDRLGIAVSGGPDSVALLLLAAAARPGNIEAATVDHDLRDGSREEALAVAHLCDRLEVPHAILTVDWPVKLETAIQERARTERYRLLAEWARTRSLDALVVAHHADDQAETLLMRLSRGAGVRGLAAMRGRSRVPGGTLPLLRPLLSWRRVDLEQVCAQSGVQALEDPSNSDTRFERVRVRQAMAEADWLDRGAVAASAAHLADAEDALDWAANGEWSRSVSEEAAEILYSPAGAPAEIERRLIARAILSLAEEGDPKSLRSRELDPLFSTLRAGGTATLRGVLCKGGEQWRFSKAPPRKTIA